MESLGVPPIMERLQWIQEKNKASDSKSHLEICFQTIGGSTFRYFDMHLPYFPTPTENNFLW